MEHLVITPEVRERCILHQYMLIDFKIQTVIKDIEVAQENMSNMELIPRAAEATLVAIRVTNDLMDKVVTISKTYLEPLRMFDAFVTGIGNVRPYN